MHKYFSDLCLCHIYYCPINQSESDGQAEDQCGRELLKGREREEIIVVLFANNLPFLIIWIHPPSCSY